MIIRNAANHAKIASNIGWAVEDVSQYIAHIEPKSDGSGYFLLPHQDLPFGPQYKPLRLGNAWVIQTGPIELDCV